MNRLIKILGMVPEWLHSHVWKKIGRARDEKLAEQLRRFHQGTSCEIQQLVDLYRRRQIAVLLVFFILTGAVLCLLETVGTADDKEILIKRNSYGEGGKEEVLILEDGETISFEVEERQYTEEELEAAFKEAFSWIRENMLKKNSSAAEVRSSLDFVTDIPGGFTAEWIPADPELVGYDGSVFNEDWEEDRKELVKVDLYLSYKERTKSQELVFRILSPEYTAREKLLRKVKKEIEKKEAQTREKATFAVSEELESAGLKIKDDQSLAGWFLLFTAGFLWLFFYGSNRMKEKGKERTEQLKEDYPVLINKLVLYLSAGMNLKNTFLQIVKEYEDDRAQGLIEKRYIYEELCVMLNEMRAGTGEIRAYEALGQRLEENAYVKLVSLLVQNLQKGNSGLLDALQAEESNAYFLRMDQAKKKGEEAGTRLLFPMLLMMIVVIVIVMAPAFFQFGGY